MYNKEHFKQQQRTFQQLLTSEKYILVCRYTNLILNEELKEKNIFPKCFKSTLFKNFFSIKKQGSFCIIQIEDDISSIITILQKKKNIEPLFLYTDKKIISYLKLKNLFKYKINNLPLLIQNLNFQISNQIKFIQYKS